MVLSCLTRVFTLHEPCTVVNACLLRDKYHQACIFKGHYLHDQLRGSSNRMSRKMQCPCLAAVVLALLSWVAFDLSRSSHHAFEDETPPEINRISCLAYALAQLQPRMHICCKRDTLHNQSAMHHTCFISLMAVKFVTRGPLSPLETNDPPTLNRGHFTRDL